MHHYNKESWEEIFEIQLCNRLPTNYLVWKTEAGSNSLTVGIARIDENGNLNQSTKLIRDKFYYQAIRPNIAADMILNIFLKELNKK